MEVGFCLYVKQAKWLSLGGIVYETTERQFPAEQKMIPYLFLNRKAVFTEMHWEDKFLCSQNSK